MTPAPASLALLSLKRAWLALLSAWAALTAGCALLQVAIFRAQPNAWTDAATPIVNATFFLASPARILIAKTLGGPASRSTQGLLAANAMTWAGAVLLVYLSLRLWRWARGPGGLREADQVDVGRRRLLADTVFTTLSASAVGGVAGVALVEPWRLTTRKHTVAVPNLPASLDGFRIAYISDTHLGPHTPRSAIDAAVRAAMQLNPDLYVLGGDYVSRGIRHIPDGAEPFRPLVADTRAAGVVAVLGNHDWYENGPMVRQSLERVGVIMLDNRRVFLGAGPRMLTRVEPDGDALCIAGVGDLDTDRVDLASALGAVRETTPRVLISHNPDVAEDPLLAGPKGHRADLMLCGHTHGGQVCLPFVGPLWVPSAYSRKYLDGLVRGPACPVVISRGVGMSVMPVRFNCPPEVVAVTLCAASDLARRVTFHTPA